ncbi:MAG: anti-sigma B factor antagonist [Parvicellaceae bacterium]|jgi:anti-sigma B factor antagonist
MALEFNYQIQDQVATLKLSGKIMEIGDTDELLSTIDKLTFEGTINFILDLNKLSYINSSGLNSLINILTKSRNAGGDTILCSVNDKISKLFLITKLNTLFTITEHENEAHKLFSEKLKV